LTRLRLFVGLGIVAAGVGTWWLTRPAPFAQAPQLDQNVLLVTVDALRADRLSAYGGSVQTQALDELVRHGTRFTWAHANTVSTLPSHATILTGRLPGDHGVRGNDGFRLSPDARLLSSRLRDAGFATGAFVGSALLSRDRGLAEGFDIYDDTMTTATRPIDLLVAERHAEAVVQSALAWQSAQTARWFAWVHLSEPHAPYEPPDQVDARYVGDPYDGEIAEVDRALGLLLRDLSRQPRPTLVIVTADHGEGLGDHLEETHGLFAYETTLRVPLVIASIGPDDGAAGEGNTVETSAQHLDLVPTVLDALALAPDPLLPGVTLRGLPARSESHRPIYFEAMSASLVRGWAPLRGVIQDRVKYIDLPVPELYDLDRDPAELRNIASTEPAIAERLRDVTRSLDRPIETSRWQAPDRLTRLRSLGYLTSGPFPQSPRADADDPKRLVEYDRVMDAAMLAFERGSYQDASVALQEVILARPGNAEAYKALAVVLWHDDQPDQAIATLRAALRAGLSQNGIPVLLGRMLAITTAAPRTIELLEGLAAGDPAALEALGIAYSQVNRMSEADEAFQAMLALDPSNARAHLNVGVLRLRQGRPVEAEASLRLALSAQPTFSSAYTPLGVALSEQGRLDESIDAWRRAVELDDSEHLALFNLTVALAEAGRGDDARAAALEFLRSAPPRTYADELALIRQLLRGD
jgi:arylsulfatase A-like enzyme/Tfp pilus assembly protein PilF